MCEIKEEILNIEEESTDEKVPTNQKETDVQKLLLDSKSDGICRIECEGEDSNL